MRRKKIQKVEEQRIEEQAAPVAAAAAPSPEQLVYARGYDHGFREGFQSAAMRVFESLGFKLTQVPSGEKSVAQTDEGEGAVHTRSSPPPSPPPSTPRVKDDGPLCAWCAHTREMHEPLTASACFDHDCKCNGFTTKAPMSVFGKKIKR